MKWFKPSTWFNSEERKLKNDMLKLQIRERELQMKMWERDIEREQLKESVEKQLNKEEFDLDLLPAPVPYRTLRLTGTTAHVSLYDGTVFTKTDVNKDFYDAVKACTTEEEVVDLFMEVVQRPTKSAEVLIETLEEVKEVTSNLSVLKLNPEFIIKDREIYLKGVDLAMPSSVSGSFIEIEERKLLAETEVEKLDLEEKFQALKMFWYWTALNPIEASRKDLLSFVRREDIKITKNGMLEMYRRVVNTGSKDKELVNFISNSYYKVKKWKKSPSNYRIVKLETGSYQLEKTATVKVGGELLGNLETLYLELPTMSENTYTDNHTRTKSIKIGEVYKEDEDKIDLDNTRSCSNGLTCSPVV